MGAMAAVGNRERLRVQVAAVKILGTGKGGTSGSWAIRGQQLGQAIGATVQPMATPSEIREADLVVVVKRTPAQLIKAIHDSGKPWVYDIVDAWPQYPGNCIDQAFAVHWLQRTIRDLKPSAVVFGTERMQSDSGFKGPSIVLPHHSWQRYCDRAPVYREKLQALGYEGGIHYLGKWLPMLEAECQARGLRLVINGDMTQADIGIALRDCGGYPARHWKPGTKLSNLHALGIPALCSPEDGYKAVACGSEHWINTPQELGAALDALTDNDRRKAEGMAARNAMLTLQSVAGVYREWLGTL